MPEKTHDSDDGRITTNGELKTVQAELKAALREIEIESSLGRIRGQAMAMRKSRDLLDIVVTMHGLDGFDRELENTIEVAIGRTKVKVLSLERIIASKKATNREKDRMVLPVLEDAAATLRERRGRK